MFCVSTSTEVLPVVAPPIAVVVIGSVLSTRSVGAATKTLLPEYSASAPKGWS